MTLSIELTLNIIL